MQARNTNKKPQIVRNKTGYSHNRVKIYYGAFESWARGGTSLTAVSQPMTLKQGLSGATRPQSAQAIVEFLLISVPLLALIFGIMEFGLAFFQSTNLDYTTREVARSTALCVNNCDITDSGGTFYRDYYALKELRNSNINLDNVEYVLIHRVAEDKDQPNIGDVTIGRAGPDIYANYQFNYQLYAMPRNNLAASDVRHNSVAARSPDTSSLLLNDAAPGQVPLLNSLPSTTYNTTYNGWRSNPCFIGLDCRLTIPRANPDGSEITGSTEPAWPGRFICAPTDRFYVQIVYRHTWITPFMPTLNQDGHSQTLRGFSESNALILSSKVYQKLETRLLTQAGICTL